MADKLLYCDDPDAQKKNTSYKLERAELDALLEVLKNTRCDVMSTYLRQTRPLLLIQNGQE